MQTEEIIQKRLHMSKRTKVLTHALLEMYHNDFDPDAPIPDMDLDVGGAHATRVLHSARALTFSHLVRL